MALRGRGKRKENDRESTISKYITSLQVEDITCTEKLLNNEG
jgi:hypothetical protein